MDAGNALFKAPGLTDAETKKRAAFVFDTMGELGTVAMAVGPRDLNLGAAWLVDQAKGKKLKVLAANLRDGEKAPFEGSTVVTVGETRVGVIGVAPEGPILGNESLKGLPLVPALKAELSKLKGKTDLVVVLSAASYADTMKAGTELKDEVDLLIESGEQRASGLQKLEKNFAVASGERGRTFGVLELELGGKGEWVDLDQTGRDTQLLKNLTSRLDELKARRAKVTDAAAKKELDGTIKELDDRVKEQSKKAGAAAGAGARTAKLSWVNLDANIGDDPALKKKVLVIEPTYAAPH